MNSKTLLSLALAFVVIAGGASAAVAGTDGGLQVDVAQNDATAEVTVEVTHNNTSVENAQVNVTVDDEDATYADAGDYQTNEDGIVELSAPDEEVNVTVTVDYENETTSVSTTLEAAPGFQVNVDQDPGEDAIVTVTDNGTAVENATVNVTLVDEDENVTYDGVGEYETDEDGTVVLPAPYETVEVEVTATHEDRTASTIVTLEAYEGDPSLPFGQQLQGYMDTIEDDEHPFGHHVANWVTKNNPGNAPAHAGPPAQAGPPDHAGPGADGDAKNESDGQGPPEHAGPGADGDAKNESNGQGPPDHAGPGDKSEAKNGTDDVRGPPAHAGPP
ncbi:hypothetical protein AArcSl_3164 [Halalkaliarchaeum desulfuricum]|uniref:Uncharacterized protein n=1 Tax=Halalkaliarchaeum desulfuricum TaxID=2055893 RepID=A0A343TNU9_9EURY|nr:hypothetical protein [Halalkaliarchaeum desulfuricum]AUX10771.1 hypothetical protein AArcSl_3164 [Halalkaliarchaeum desulfuricum]